MVKAVMERSARAAQGSAIRSGLPQSLQAARGELNDCLDRLRRLDPSLERVPCPRQILRYIQLRLRGSDVDACAVDLPVGSILAPAQNHYEDCANASTLIVVTRS